MDEIKGVAVLNDTVPEQALYVVCVPDKALHLDRNEAFISRLAVCPHDLAPAAGSQWKYRVKDNVLHVYPSLRVSSSRPIPGSEKNEEFELFHNGGTWSVQFVRWSEIAAKHEAGGPWLACEGLNRELLA